MLAKALAPVAAAALLAAPLASPGETAPATKEVHRTVALDRDGRLSVEAYKGSIQIAAWDKAEAEVTARIEADSNCGDAGYQAEMVRDTDVVISGGGASVSVRSDYDRVRDRSVWHFFSSCSSLPYVRYTISMPRAARLDVHDYKSEIRISDLSSSVSLKTYKGEVRISGLSGSLDLDTYKGDVRADLKNLTGASRFETYKGDVEISLPRDAKFAVNADMGRRGHLDSDFPVMLRSGSRRGSDSRTSGEVNGGGPELSLKTYRGSFRLRRSA